MAAYAAKKTYQIEIIQLFCEKEYFCLIKRIMEVRGSSINIHF